MRTTLPHLALHVVIACATFAAGYTLRPAAAPASPDLTRPRAAKPVFTRPLAQAAADVHRLRESSSSFTRPLLECDQDAPTFDELRPAQLRLQALIGQKIKAGEAMNISAYFRELDSGHWFGVNDEERFAPASLLKIPVLLAVLTLAESHPGLLAEKLTAPDTLPQASDPFYPPAVVLQPGLSYSVEELLQHMIAYSDNNAKDMLISRLDASQLDVTYTKLGIDAPGVTTAADFVTAQDIGRFFQVLYNATYLSHEMSEKALGLLAMSRFGPGLVAGVPAGTVVAHKFGLRLREDGAMQLHDCGIIYAPHRPYLLCVMARGAKGQNLAPVIRDISKQVHDDLRPSALTPAKG